MYPVTMFYCIYYEFVCYTCDQCYHVFYSNYITVYPCLPTNPWSVYWLCYKCVPCDCVFHGAIFYCTSDLYLPPGVPGLLEGAGDPLPPELSHCPCRESFMALVASCCLANCSSAILLALSSYFSLSSLFKFLHCENTSVSQTNDLSDPLPVQQIIYLR